MVNPIRGEYVTARIPVRNALLQSPDLLKYATPQKQITQPGLVTPEHFPTLVYLSLTILSLTSSPPSGARKTFDKADLDTVKRKLDFGTSTTAKPAEAHEEMTSLNLETTSGSTPNTPSNIETPYLSNLSAARRQSQATPIIGDSVENTVSPSQVSRPKSKRKPQPISLAAFQRSVSVPSSPLEEIQRSRNIKSTILSMISPERIDSLLKHRPCLVLNVEGDKSPKYILLAVTHFGGKTIKEAKMAPQRKIYALPIAPNTVDMHGRLPLKTDPPWPDNYSYQVLIPNEANPDEVLPREGRQIILREIELQRIEEFLNERADVQTEISQFQYATSQSLPIQIIPGITKDADPSTTLDEDVKVIDKMIDGIISDKKSGGTLLEKVFDSLDDSWTRVGPKGCPLMAKNIGEAQLGEGEESGRRGNTTTRRNRSRRPTRTGRGRIGTTAHEEPTTCGDGGRGNRAVTYRGRSRGAGKGRVRSTGGGIAGRR